MKRQKSIITCTAVVWCGCVSSCAFLPENLFPPPPDDLPDSLEFVVASKEQFRPTDDSSLADVAAGTVIDDLSSLSGCWGYYSRNSETPTQQEIQDGFDSEFPVHIQLPPLPRDRLRVDFYSALEFDPVEGRVTSWSMTNYFAGYGVVVTGTRSSYAVIAPYMIEELVLQDYDSSEGDGDPSAAVVLEDLPSERQDTFTWTATLSGDYLKVRHAIIDPIELVDVVIYKRFDCPATGETASNPD